jgi:hypothetical protein
MTTTQQVVITKLRGNSMSSTMVNIMVETLSNCKVLDHAVDEENGVMYTTISTSDTLKEINSLISQERVEGFGNCSHDHDCCGCYFLSMMFAIPLFDDGKDYFIIKEVWARNV